MVDGIDWTDPIVGFDLQTTVIGVAVIRGRDYRTEHLKLSGEIDEKLHTFRRWLRWYIQENQPAIIACEAPIIYKNRENAAIPILHFHGVFKEALCKCISAKLYIPEATWKKEVCGRGNITTAQKKNGAVMLALNHMNFDVRQLDEADALSVALCARKKLFGDITR